MDMNIINKISGGAHMAGVKLLYELTQECPTDRILEMGSFVGKSACIMGCALKEAGRKGTIICIDRFQDGMRYWGPGHPTYTDAIKSFWEHVKYAGIEDYIVSLKGEIGTITKNMNGKFGMIYIDGGHELQNVLINALWAWEHTVEGGIILFDDYDVDGKHPWKDVKTAVDCLLIKWEREVYKRGALMVAVKR